MRAPDVGWGAARTVGELAGALALLGAFVVNERRSPGPLLPLSIFRPWGSPYSPPLPPPPPRACWAPTVP
ncbi:MAG: hypothetical protein ABSE77_03250 [Acidimicrobiales bacterium]